VGRRRNVLVAAADGDDRVLRQRAGRARTRTVLAHRRERKLGPGEIVKCEIEILPSATLFRPDETLRVVVQGKDIYRYPRPLIQARHEDSVNRGRHVIHTGGEYPSHLLFSHGPYDD